MSKGIFYRDKPYRRVVYKRNTLAEVVCQIRFPQLLKIETGLPDGFQERIISDYPFLEQQTGFEVAFAANKGISHSITWQFRSSDKIWLISLSKGFLAVSTTQYTSWEDFLVRVRAAVDALLNNYGISIYTRIGLRYKNIIDKVELKLSDVSWVDLINPSILGILASCPKSEQLVKGTQGTTILDLGDITARVQYGLVAQQGTSNIGFLLDNDFFSEQQDDLNIDNIVKELVKCHDNSGPLFDWCITEKLRSALKH